MVDPQFIKAPPPSSAHVTSQTRALVIDLVHVRWHAVQILRRPGQSALVEAFGPLHTPVVGLLGDDREADPSGLRLFEQPVRHTQTQSTSRPLTKHEVRSGESLQGPCARSSDYAASAEAEPSSREPHGSAPTHWRSRCSWGATHLTNESPAQSRPVLIRTR